MPTCFVLMPFGELDPIFELAIRPAVRDIGWECRRAKDIPPPAIDTPLRKKIHEGITEAAIVIGDVTGSNPNVLYEIGYAEALGKDVVLITQDDQAKVVSSLRGLEVLAYDRDSPAALRQRLKDCLEALLPRETGYLRDMLAPPDDGNSYILTSPREASPDEFKEPPMYKTYGDYLGVVGIIRAFGMMYGERRVPELLDARLAREDVVRSNNVYILGSCKVNRFQEEYLEEIQRGRPPKW